MTALTDAGAALFHLRASHGYTATKVANPSRFGATEMGKAEAALLAVIADLSPAVPPPPPVTPPLLDLRANSMRMKGWLLPPNPVSVAGPGPVPFDGPNDGLLYGNGDISLIDDPRWGTVYRVRLTRTSSNPWWAGENASGKISAELTKGRTITPGEVNWYANSYFIHPGFGPGSFGELTQYGYPTLSSPPFGFGVTTAGVVLERNSGVLTYQPANQYWQAEITFKLTLMSLASVAGAWLDAILGVKWEPDHTGWVELHTRLPGGPFVREYQDTNTPTMQQRRGDPLVTTVHEKNGIYQDSSQLSASFIQNVCDQRGTTLHATYADAVASLA